LLALYQVQLDKVAAACMTAQGFGERIDQLQQDLTSTDSKVVFGFFLFYFLN
jgi:hypothetical protein